MPLITKSLRGKLISLPENRVEPPETLKSARKCNINHWQNRVRKELFRQEESPGLRQLNRRNAQILEQDPPQMSIRYAQICGEICNAPFLKYSRLDLFDGSRSKAVSGVGR